MRNKHKYMYIYGSSLQENGKGLRSQTEHRKRSYTSDSHENTVGRLSLPVETALLEGDVGESSPVVPEVIF